MSTAPTFVNNYRSGSCRFVNAGEHVAVLFRGGPNGSRIHKISAAQDTTQTVDLQFFKARVLTDNSRVAPFVHPEGTGLGLHPVLALTNTTNSTITRTNGSFIQDGWRLQDGLAVLGSNTNIQNQIIGHPTTVAAGTLTFTGVMFQAADASPSPLLQLARTRLLFSKALISGAGNSGSVAGLNYMDTTLYPSLLASPDSFILLGPDELLLAGWGAYGAVFASLVALPAVNKSVDIDCEGGDY